MRRNVVFDKARGWRSDDDGFHRMRLGADRGATIGEYGPQETSEFSDAYFGPGDSYPRREHVSGGYSREQQPIRESDLRGARPVGRFAPERHPDHRIYGEIRSFGELHEGQRSWADLGVSSLSGGRRETSDPRQPSFRGRGPKGYARSDERLTEVICERLTEDPRIDAREIEVKVADGKVTLSGTVNDRRTKWRVEDLAEACSGVSFVENQLRVRASGR